MPQLPSGRHAGIEPDRIVNLMKDAECGRFVHKLMAITEDADVLPYIEVIELIPSEGESSVVFSDGSEARPCEFAKVLTGITLEHVDELGSRWSGDDLAAFKAFVDEPRNIQYRRNLLNAVLELQQVIERDGAYVARLQALWWRAGIHPAQEEGWQDDDPTVWDDYDLLVALYTIVAGMSEEAPMEAAARHVLMLSKAFLSIVIQQIPGFAKEVADLKSAEVRGMADELRSRRVLDDLSEKDLTWFHSQGRESASALCGAFDGAELRKIDRIAACILALVFVSNENDRLVDLREEI